MEYIMDHMLWVEKYRPAKIADCILPEKIKDTFQEFANRSEEHTSELQSH